MSTPAIELRPLPGPIRARLTRQADDLVADWVPRKHRTALLAALEAAARTGFDIGIDHALDSESEAWKRCTDLEDVLIAIVRHAPDSDLVRARKVAAGVEAQFAPEEDEVTA